MPFLLVYTTVAEEADASRLAQEAVRARLAACAHIESLESVYAWQGELVQGREFRLTFKTTPGAYAALEALLRAGHPYEEPAIYAIDADRAAPGFLTWVRQSVHVPPVARSGTAG